MKESLERLNALSPEEAEAEFLKCCGSTLWARRMMDERPFHDLQELLTKADAEWWALDKEDWLEAFSRHPKIGEQKSERAQAEETLCAAATKLREGKVSNTLNITTEVMVGSPKRIIVEEAEKWGADLIVVGSHGYRSWERMLLGSVSQAVALHAECSVEFVRKRSRVRSLYRTSVELLWSGKDHD